MAWLMLGVLEKLLFFFVLLLLLGYLFVYLLFEWRFFYGIFWFVFFWFQKHSVACVLNCHDMTYHTSPCNASNPFIKLKNSLKTNFYHAVFVLCWFVVGVSCCIAITVICLCCTGPCAYKINIVSWFFRYELSLLVVWTLWGTPKMFYNVNIKEQFSYPQHM